MATGISNSTEIHMGSTRHEKSFVDFEQPYEQNIIGLKGIVYFGVGLLILIIITFGLMWALLGVMIDQEAETAAPTHPLAMSEREKLPPEPRLQSAPGFEVATTTGKVNLELLAPQAEYNELRKDWESIWHNGVKDEKTGTVTVMPIEAAKERLLGQSIKARNGADAERSFAESTLYFSDSSAGRVASEKLR
jgi:hypothetical protein